MKKVKGTKLEQNITLIFYLPFSLFFHIPAVEVKTSLFFLIKDAELSHYSRYVFSQSTSFTVFLSSLILGNKTKCESSQVLNLCLSLSITTLCWRF